MWSSDDGFRPIAVRPKTNDASARRDKDGRSALCKIDLTDKDDPHLMLASSRVDVLLAPVGIGATSATQESRDEPRS